MRIDDVRQSGVFPTSLEGPCWTDLERIRYLRRLIVASQARLLELHRKPTDDDLEASLEGACFAGFLRELRRLETDLAVDPMLDIRCSTPCDLQETGDGLLR